MKKILFAMLIMVCGIICSANAQIITAINTGYAYLDLNNDGIWDTKVIISKVPCADRIRTRHTLANELGRCYCANLWRQYEAQGVNPASYGIPNPNSEANFTQYASAYSHLISYSGGMGMVGMGIPGTASVGVNIGGVGVGVNIPVNTGNGIGILQPNASIGVNVKGNGGYVSIPVSLNTKKNSSRRQTTRTTVPTATQQQTRVVTTPTHSSTPKTDSIEMSVEEIQNMLDGSYM